MAYIHSKRDSDNVPKIKRFTVFFQRDTLIDLAKCHESDVLSVGIDVFSMPLFCRVEGSVLPVKFVSLPCKGGHSQVVVVVEAGDGTRLSSHQGSLWC